MSIHLTDRDLDIMLALARNGFLTVKQIQNKWFVSYKTCIRRLAKLVEYKYLNVTYIERFGSGIYLLTKDGLNFINDYYGCEYRNYGKSSKINHFLSCGTFYLNFPYEIIEYEIEYYLEELIPDIYVKYKINKETDDKIDLLVEIDNTGKMNIIKHKIDSYNKYVQSHKWKDHFDLFPKCIIITKGNFNIKDFETIIPFKILNFDNINRLKSIL